MNPIEILSENKSFPNHFIMLTPKPEVLQQKTKDQYLSTQMQGFLTAF